MSTVFDESILAEVVAGRICFTRLLRRHRRGISRLVAAGRLDVWLRPDHTVITLTAWEAERRGLELDEDLLDRDGELVEVPIWRASVKILTDDCMPCWAHPIVVPKEVGFFELRYPELIPDHREPDPSDAPEPEPLETDLGVAITVGSVPAYADIDVRRWLHAKKLNRIAVAKAKKAKKLARVG